MRPYRQTCTCLGHGLDESSSLFRPRCRCLIRPRIDFLLAKPGGLDTAWWTIEPLAVAVAVVVAVAVAAVAVAFVVFVSKSSLPDLVDAWQFLANVVAFLAICFEECPWQQLVE